MSVVCSVLWQSILTRRIPRVENTVNPTSTSRAKVNVLVCARHD
jgi:hypothetical protein